jgi:hypothetical protein
MTLLAAQSFRRRFVADLALFVASGLVMAVLGPFQTADRPFPERLIYWQACIVGGAMIGVAIDELVRRRARAFWPRLIAASVLMTAPVTLLVVAVDHVMYDQGPPNPAINGLAFQVFVVSFAVMTLRQLAWAHSVAPAQAADAPGEDPLRAFRQRLSAKRRAARLIAVEAEDHYLRVHTDAGDELITARFGDALSELAAAPGFQTHRSWWVAADAIEDVRWLRGRGEARLTCGLVVPISRGQAAPLKAAGWF